MRQAMLMVAVLAASCSKPADVKCGKGTVLKDGQCVVAEGSAQTLQAQGSAATAPTKAGVASADPWKDPKPAPPPTPEGPQWHFDSDQDRMRGTTTYFAGIRSTNTVNFRFPYDGGSFLKLIFRKGHPGSGGEIEALLEISKGQFQCSSYDGCAVSLKFDTGQVERWGMLSASGLSTETIFFGNASGLLARIKKAKTLTIEPTFTEGGRFQFTFDVPSIDGWEALKPPPPPKPGTPPPPITGYCFESGGNTSCGRSLDDCKTYMQAKNATDASCKHVGKVPCAFEPGTPYCDTNE